MRTTLTIDDDLLAAARGIAQAKSITVGEALSELARRGLESNCRMERKGRKGFPVFSVPPGARPITIEDVRKLEDEA